MNHWVVNHVSIFHSRFKILIHCKTQKYCSYITKSRKNFTEVSKTHYKININCSHSTKWDGNYHLMVTFRTVIFHTVRKQRQRITWETSPFVLQLKDIKLWSSLGNYYSIVVHSISCTCTYNINHFIVITIYLKSTTTNLDDFCFPFVSRWTCYLSSYLRPLGCISLLGRASCCSTSLQSRPVLCQGPWYQHHCPGSSPCSYTWYSKQ